MIKRGKTKFEVFEDGLEFETFRPENHVCEEQFG